MGYRYRYNDGPVFWRGIAIGAVVTMACAGAYLGLSAPGIHAGDELTMVGLASTTTSTTSTTSTTIGTSTTSTTAPTPTSTALPALTASNTPTTSTTPSTTTSPSTSTSTTVPEAAPPVVAIFDVETITLAGAVPTRAAADRLTMLAQANSKTAAAVIDLLTIDASVPPDVGVRVVELTSSRFPAGKSTITLAHGAELQRMVDVMAALPYVSVVVIGHADQVGSDSANMALSADRAEAVVSFMIDQGVAPQRLSAQAVGESDLLSLDDDAAALALNRRTEFVVHGALLDA
jgi:outer membrane protein OmpA-like peptidoglycan-associated protein